MAELIRFRRENLPGVGKSQLAFWVEGFRRDHARQPRVWEAAFRLQISCRSVLLLIERDETPNTQVYVMPDGSGAPDRAHIFVEGG